METRIFTQLNEWIARQIDQRLEAPTVSPIGGGCIHQCYILSGREHSYFVKLNHVSALEVFKAEAEGIEAISKTQTIAIPGLIGFGTIEEHSFLVLDRVEFGSATAGSWQAMGQQLANLHRCTADQYGWQSDNFIGSSPQYNKWTENWANFFRERRLRPQFEMAARNGLGLKHAEALLDSATTILASHKPPPALLHGDLWSGNASFLNNGSPVIYDPASYYGDRETDLAFTEFFGGFPPAFYQAYQAEWPLPEGFPIRKQLYNLYHALNHANLFGGGYTSQAQGMIHELLQ